MSDFARELVDEAQSEEITQMSEAERVPFKIKVGYGAGHVMNDMCASMWFSYLLLFFHKVLQFDNNYSGIILLIGNLVKPKGPHILYCCK